MSESDVLPPLLTVKQTAQRLGISMYLVRKLADQEALRSDWVEGRLYVLTDSVEQYLANFGTRVEESA